MCGIFGYVGARDALPILLDGLKRLEYRGYDSTGVALMDGKDLAVRKARGRLDVLRESLAKEPLAGTCGIGHTRWATHGEPSDENAHPHTDGGGRFAVVHNGIIENHTELRQWLEMEGYVFRSQTDTEVIAHLLARFWRGDIRKTLQDVLPHLRGSFALCVLCKDAPGVLCCTRKDSPLVIGLSEGEQFIASDIPALLLHTRTVLMLEDREIALVRQEGCECYGPFGQPVQHDAKTIEWDAQSADLGGYPHFMLKEIAEQPVALRSVLEAYTLADGRALSFRPNAIPLASETAATLSRVVLVGCGSAYHAAAVGKAIIERLARLPVDTDIASEFRYRDPLLGPGDLCVFISQSGETADTVAAMRMAATKAPAAQILAIVNAVGSTLTREAAGVLYTQAGPEIAVATTKGYTTQVMVLTILALYLAHARGVMDSAAVSEALGWLSQAPAQAEAILRDVRRVQRFASANADQRSVFYIGRGLDYALSLEASLKLKEITYTHSEAYAAGELKHGAIALIEPGSLVVALATQAELLDKALSNMREVRARGANVLALTTAALKDRVQAAAAEVWDIPNAPDICLPVLSILSMQLFAYYVALARGLDVDKPRNLAKSVTVE